MHKKADETSIRFAKMKAIIKTVFFIFLISCSTTIFGQQDADFYKQRLEECLSKNDCDRAQIMYNGYKDAIDKADVNIEARIKACRDTQLTHGTTSFEDSNPYLQKAKELFKSGDYEEAIKNFNLYKAYVQNSEQKQNADTWINNAKECQIAIQTANRFYYNGNYKDAMPEYYKVVRLNPDDLYAKKRYDYCDIEVATKTNSGVLIIKGTIVDKTGEPLIGVSIVIKGSTIGTISDIDGNFSLACPKQEAFTLTVQYVGYKTKNIPVNMYANNNSLKIILEEKKKLLF